MPRRCWSARHAISAAEVRNCRKVDGSLQLLAELDATFHAR